MEIIFLYSHRKKRLTASNFGLVMKRRESIFPKSILDKILNASHSSTVSGSCRWGKDNEEAALLKYFMFKKSSNTEVQVCRSVGLVVNPKWSWLGASPDALLCDPMEPSCYGAVEIKCPSSKINLTINEACEETNFYLKYKDGKASLNRDHIYFYQLQGVMAICQLSWIDFVVYTVKDLHVERIYFDALKWDNNMLPKLTNFYFKFLV